MGRVWLEDFQVFAFREHLARRFPGFLRFGGDFGAILEALLEAFWGPLGAQVGPRTAPRQPKTAVFVSEIVEIY